MGRAKLNMELITKEKSRNVTFKKRKEGLIRKMHEFTTLCDVSACMIIYPPKQENGTAVDNQPEIWPQNIDEVRRIIETYKSKNRDSRNKEYSLSDFFHDRKRKVEDELSKLRRKNREANYPTWIESLNFMAEAGLRDFCSRLRYKAEHVKSKIEFLRREKEGLSGMGLINNHQPTPAEMHFPVFYNPTTTNHHQDMHFTNHNSMMSLLTSNDNDDDDRLSQFGVPSSSSFQPQFFFEPAVEPMVCYGPAMPAVPPMYVMHGVAPPQLQMQDIGQYDQMMNPRARYF